jgi:DNA-binding NarL/FixJ family response regulator
MGHVDFCLIADHNADRRNGLKQTISNNKLATEVVASLNCGHGLLYLNQSYEKVDGKQLVVILNGRTPMMSGFEFLNELNKGLFRYDRDKVKIVVLADGISDEEERKYRLHGVVDFIECDMHDDGLCDKLRSIFQATSSVPKSKASRGGARMKKIVKAEDAFQQEEGKHVYLVPKSQVG